MSGDQVRGWEVITGTEELMDANKEIEDIEKLANFIIDEVDSEPSESESVVDCAIRVIRVLTEQSGGAEGAAKLVALRIMTVMNHALKADLRAITDLVDYRVECNKELADHPSIQVAAYGASGDFAADFTVGLLGLLNGIAGAHPDGYGRIEASYDVECPKECQPSDDQEGHVVGDPCPQCGTDLALGKLLGFQLSDSAKHQEPPK